MQEPSITDPKGTLDAFDQRLKRLELHVFGEAAPVQPSVPVTTEHKLPVPTVPLPPPPATRPDAQMPPGPQPDAPPPPAAVPQPDPAPAVPPTPINVGRILSVAGNVFLVIGGALLLMYSWQYFGAWFKVGGGLALSAFLVGWGERLSRRETNQWYGQGLIGAGWSLAYFVVYAMQNIATVKVLDGVVLDCTLLVTLAAGCMAHAVRKRSETMAVLSTVLSFVTISLSTVTLFSVAACAVLVLGVSAVIVKMNWQRVFACTVVGSYLTFSIFTNPQILASASTAESGLMLSGAFLLLFWLANNVVTYLVAGKRSGKETGTDSPLDALLTGHIPGLVPSLAVLNAVAFVTLGLLSLGDAGLHSARYLFLFATGAVYLGISPMFARRDSALSTATTLLGLVCTTSAIPMKLNPHATNSIWLIEAAVLVWAGLRYNLVSFRWFAVALSALLAVQVGGNLYWDATMVHGLNMTMEWRVLLGLLAATTFGASSYLYERARNNDALRAFEREWRHFYLVIAALMLWLLPVATATATMQPLVFLVEGAFLLLIARRNADVIKHGTAAVFFASACVAVLQAQAVLNPWLAAGALVFVAVAGMLYRFDNRVALVHAQRLFTYRGYFLVVAGTALAYTLLQRGSFGAASTMLSFEVAALLAAAILLRDRVLSAAACAGAVLVAIATFVNHDFWSWLNVLPPIILAYAGSALFGWYAIKGGIKGSQFTGEEWTSTAEESGILRSAFGVGASALLTVAFASLLSGPWISVAWALQGIALLALGFRFNEVTYRSCGLAIFALLAGKVLFFDLSDAPTIQRILSFIVTGVAFLVGSYAYAWFRKQASDSA